MKKVLLGLSVLLLAMAAFAMPSPKQIEDALAAQKYVDARGMVQEVLREKPDSARAHLLNAFLLIHVDHNKTAANSELQTAAGLDRKGDVKSSPLFGRVVAEIDMQPAKPSTLPNPSAVPVHHSSGIDPLDVFFFLLLIGGIAIMGIALLRPRDWDVVVVGSGGSAGVSGGTTIAPVPGSPLPGGAFYPHASTTIVQAAGNPSMGAFGTAAAVAGGVVAGELIADSLTHRSRRRADDEEDDRRRRESSYQPSYTPDPSPVSYESERSSFSSSSSGGDSWGGSDSSSSSSDSGSSWE